MWNVLHRLSIPSLKLFFEPPKFFLFLFKYSMKKNVKASKKYKINFGPQHPYKKRYLANIIRTPGVFIFRIQV